MVQIKTALISVFNKDGLIPILEELNRLSVKILSTGGTWDFITKSGYNAEKVEDITNFPAIFGGRVKTLHPKIFGGILARRNDPDDKKEKENYKIPMIDMVIVDLYPFIKTLESGASENDIIEKIDIGGISLIRAAAKNFRDVLVIPSKDQYSFLLDLLVKKGARSDLSDRRLMASQAFNISSYYDQKIYQYLSSENAEMFKNLHGNPNKLRYGENPHQDGYFYGDLEESFYQLHGKQISYNNILDIDSALKLISEFDTNTFAIIKHLNPCGIATRSNLWDAWADAFACDPQSAFGGIIATKGIIQEDVAAEIDKIFFEVIIASGYSLDSLQILKSKKNRIILQLNEIKLVTEEMRSALTGMLVQGRDSKIETESDFKVVTKIKPDKSQVEDLIFALKCVKHLKSNAIAIVKDKQLIGAGMGQTSRIEAVEQAINKARRSNFDLQGAVMASDAYFPFHDSVKFAHDAGIKAVIQPGGSVRDQESIDFCNENKLPMIFTGIRHFKH